MERGLIMAFSAVTLWGILDAASRYSVVTLGVDPWMFSCINLMAGGAVMVMVAGRKHHNMSTLYNAHTWLFGFFRVLTTLCLVFAFTSISASEANFMLRINVIMGFIAAYLLFKRKMHKTDIPGGILLIIGFLTIALRQEDGFLNFAVILVIIAAVCDIILITIAETHPVSKRASGLKARLRYTGFVLLVTSFFFMGIAFLLAQLKANLDISTLPLWVQTPIDQAPTLKSFSTPLVWVTGVTIGIFLRAPSMYLYLYAARLLKTEVLTMAATFAPFAALGAEGLFFAFGLMHSPTLDIIDIFAGTLMTAGAFSMIGLRILNGRKRATTP